MTEWQWLADENALRMLGRLLAAQDPRMGLLRWLRPRAGPTKPNERKLRLFGAACCWRFWAVGVQYIREGIEAAEEFADGRAGPEALVAASRVHLGDPSAGQAALAAVRYILAEVAKSRVRSRRRGRCEEGRQQALLLRDIFGNPFQPIRISPAWHTDTALALARQMYETRDFSAMPILADALQDAGCDDDEVLNHCRHDVNHARGCWVVDALLRKE